MLTRARLALAGVVLALLGLAFYALPVPPAVACCAVGQHTQCKARAIHVVQTLRVCKVTDYMVQPDGHGLWEIAVHTIVTSGCSLLEGTGGRITRQWTQTQHTTFPYWPVAHMDLGRQYRCRKSWAVGQPGPESGPMRVQTGMHLRINAANDWNPVFTETLYRP